MTSPTLRANAPSSGLDDDPFHSTQSWCGVSQMLRVAGRRIQWIVIPVDTGKRQALVEDRTESIEPMHNRIEAMIVPPLIEQNRLRRNGRNQRNSKD